MMSKIEVESLKNAIAEKLDIEVQMITPEARIREDLGADSLDLYEIAYLLESEFGIVKGEEKLSALITIQDFIDFVGLDGEELVDEWKELNLEDGKHDWETKTTEKGLLIRYKDKDFIIKKSGDTWVILYKKLHRICFRPDKYALDDISSGAFSILLRESPGHFPIFKSDDSKIEADITEITDDIAKLKPMVKCVNGDDPIGFPVKLIHVVGVQAFNEKYRCKNDDYYDVDWMHVNKCFIATVSDLEES